MLAHFLYGQMTPMLMFGGVRSFKMLSLKNQMQPCTDLMWSPYEIRTIQPCQQLCEGRVKWKANFDFPIHSYGDNFGSLVE